MKQKYKQALDKHFNADSMKSVDAIRYRLTINMGLYDKLAKELVRLELINKISCVNIPFEKWKPLNEKMKTCIQNIATKCYVSMEDYHCFRETAFEAGNYEILGDNYVAFRTKFKHEDLLALVSLGELGSNVFFKEIFGL